MIAEKRHTDGKGILKWIGISFCFLVSIQTGFGQKVIYKNYIIENDMQKLSGEIILRDNFWSRSITFYNKEKGIAKLCHPGHIKKFVKGDSTFISVYISNQLGIIKSYASNHYALLLIKDTMNLYKTYSMIDNKPVEVFLYYRPGMKEIKMIKDEKSSVISAVEDCKPLVNEINKNGFVYSEEYMRKLTDSYNAWVKDTTISIGTFTAPSLDSAKIAVSYKTIFLTDRKSDILRLTGHHIYVVGYFFIFPLATVNRYYYKGDFKQPCGLLGESIRPIIQQFPESEKHLNTYRNLRIAGIAQMVLAPALFVKAVSVDPEGNSVDYWLASSFIVGASGALFYHYIARPFLRKSVRSFNKNLLEKRYREQMQD